MSVTNAALYSASAYGTAVGRGDLEAHVIQTLRDWIVPYIADYERQHNIRARALPVPPTPESIHGGVDWETFSGELFPQIIVIVQPTGTIERFDEDGTYGSWFTVEVGAVVSFEGDQDQTRRLGDIYGSCLQKLVPQQGAFGKQPDEETDFATRTRLLEPYRLDFQDETVRDIIRATVAAETFLDGLVSDYAGPNVPPADPYATPLPPTTADKVKVDLIRGTPDTSGLVTADGVVLDGTVYPPVVRHVTETVFEPPDEIPEADNPTD